MSVWQRVARSASLLRLAAAAAAGLLLPCRGAATLLCCVDAAAKCSMLCTFPQTLFRLCAQRREAKAHKES